MKEKNFGRTKKTLKEQTAKSMKVVVIYSEFAPIDILIEEESDNAIQ